MSRADIIRLGSSARRLTGPLGCPPARNDEVYPNYNSPQMFIAKSKMFARLPLLGVKPIKGDQ
jgi:hypothetical protein